MNIVGNAIKTARRMQGISQKELAAHLGCSVAAVSRHESGNRDMKCGTLVKIAHALGIRPSTLIGEEIEDKAIVMTQRDVRMEISAFCLSDSRFEIRLSGGERIRVRNGSIEKIVLPTEEERENIRKRWAEIVESVKHET